MKATSRNFHVIGRYVDGDLANGIDQSCWRLGFGWHGLLGEKADLVGEVGRVDTEVANVGDDGYQITGGVRWKPLGFLELEGFVNYIDLDAAGSEETYEARAIFEVWCVGLGAAYETGDTADQWSTFVRFTFGKE